MKTLRVISLLLILAIGIFAQVTPNPFGGGGDFLEEERIEDYGKSKWAAAALSILVPGAGQLYLGDKRAAGYFMAAEGAVWGTFTGLTVRGNWLKEEYRNYSAIHAGVHPEGKDDQFFEDVLMFGSQETYENWYHLVYRDEVETYPNTEEYFWEWTSDEEWDTYADIRSESETAYRNAKIALAAGLINRVISVVHVMRYQPPEPDLSESGINLRPIAFTEQAPAGRLSLGVGVSGEF